MLTGVFLGVGRADMQSAAITSSAVPHHHHHPETLTRSRYCTPSESRPNVYRQANTHSVTGELSSEPTAGWWIEHEYGICIASKLLTTTPVDREGILLIGCFWATVVDCGKVQYCTQSARTMRKAAHRPWPAVGLPKFDSYTPDSPATYLPHNTAYRDLFDP